MATFVGTNQADTIVGTSNGDTISSGNGDDVVDGGAGNDTISGGNGNDSLVGGGGHDMLNGGNGDDTLAGGDDNDTLDGGNGDDIVDGGTGNDTISGGNGNDSLVGGGGNDTLTGGNGDDTLTGGDDDDTLDGSNGDDTIDGGAGSDTVNGDRGDDVAVYVASENLAETDSYDGGQGRDRLRIVLTQSQANSAAMQADIQAFWAFIALHSNSSSTDGPIFQFSAVDLTVRNFEQLEIIVIPGDGGATYDFTFQEGAESATIVGGSGVDTLNVTYNGTQVTQITSDGQITNGHLLIDFDNDGQNDLTVSGIEELVVNAKHVVVTGDLSHTGLANDTITYHGTPPDDDNTFDASEVTSDENVIAYGYGGSDTLKGAGGRDFLDGGDGDDFLYGNGANDQFIGGAGNDLLDGGDRLDRAIYTDATGGISVDLASGVVTGDASVGTDTLRSIEFVRGSNFADVYVATGYGEAGAMNVGNDAASNNFEGLAGNDTIIGNGQSGLTFINAAAGVMVDIAAGTATGDASVGNDTFSGVRAIRASNHNDTILGSANGEFFIDGGGDDFIDGRGGFDIFRYFSFIDDVTSTTGVTIDMAGGLITGDLGTDTLRSIEAVVGTNAADVYVATGFGQAGALNVGSSGTFNEFEGRGGNDTVTGNSNTRIAFRFANAGVAVNLATGTATGDDTGSDSFTGVNAVIGSRFGDIILGDAANNTFVPGPFGPGIVGFDDAADVIDGGAGLDRVDYSGYTGNLTVTLAGSTPVIVGGSGSSAATSDTIVNIENFTGGSGNDIIIGDGNQNSFVGGAGNDLFQGGAGNDFLDGGADRFDRAIYTDATAGINIAMASGVVTGSASVGTDTLRSVEYVKGSNFDDVYDATGYGQAGALNVGNAGTLNNFEGMGGNDTIIGNGQSGLWYTNATSGITLDIAAGTATGDASVGTDSFTGVNFIRASDYNDTLLGSNNVTVGEQFVDSGGDDFIDGRGGFDIARYFTFIDEIISTGVTIDMAAGLVTGDLGTDTLRSIEGAVGTSSADTYIATGFGQAGALNVGSLGTFNDFEGVGGNDTITGNGNTRLTFAKSTAGVAVDLAAGTATGDASVGSDTFTGVNAVSGSDFDDMILGDAANNQISGNGGNDRIEGRSGNDSLSGGAGTDTFVFETGFGQDTITGFTAGSGAGHDIIEFEQAIFADFDAVLDAAADVGGNVVITAGADKITILGMTKTSLTVDDFQFV